MNTPTTMKSQPPRTVADANQFLADQRQKTIARIRAISFGPPDIITLLVDQIIRSTAMRDVAILSAVGLTVDAARAIANIEAAGIEPTDDEVDA